MDFDLTEDQKEIKRVAHALLQTRSPFAAVRTAAESGSYDEKLRLELIALGWPGIAVDEAHGGQGLGAVELAVLAEELGYACAATPLVPTAAAALAIQAAGSAKQQQRWLPGLASGELAGAIGTRELAADAAGADVAVLTDGDDATLHAAPRTSPFNAIDPTRRYAVLDADGEGEPLGAGAADRIRLVLAAEVLGLCQRALEMTLEYVKDRKQFGVPVGSFQAVSAPLRADALAHRRARDRRSTTPRGRRTPIPTGCRRLQRSPRRPRPRADARSPRARSRPTERSASPGRPMSTGSTSAPSSTSSCSAGPAGTAPRSRGWPPAR